ncbi:MAG: hypothetical protein JXA21_21090 [Anaerolineae bacterium]|nr:hypothetical protein [Anaerolineae bacterium]
MKKKTETPESKVVRTTIVGGRPPAQGRANGNIPRGIEVLIKKAAVDPDFHKQLLAKRAGAAQEIALELTMAETLMINSIPAAQLDAIIANTQVPDPERRAFLGKIGTVMLAAIGATACNLFRKESGGARPDTPTVNPETTIEGIQPDDPTATPAMTLGSQPDDPTATPELVTRGIRPDDPTATPVMTKGIRPDDPTATPAGIRPTTAPTGSRPDDPTKTPGDTSKKLPEPDDAEEASNQATLGIRPTLPRPRKPRGSA